MSSTMQRWLLVTGACAVLSGCATPDGGDTGRTGLNAGDSRALIARLLPPGTSDRAGWATDIYAAFATQDIATTPENICAVLAVTEQESTFRADPPVPGLAAIAWQEIDQQAERVGVPKFAVHAALRLPSSNGKSYSDRIDAVTTEKQLSEIFEDFIGMVPLGKTFLASRNPVRTGGPMQVSIAFAEAQRGGESISVSGRTLDPARSIHPTRRHVLRHRASARIRRAVCAAAVSLRRFQRRPLRQPQRGLPERAEHRVRRSVWSWTGTCCRRALRLTRPPEAPNSPRSLLPSGSIWQRPAIRRDLERGTEPGIRTHPALRACVRARRAGQSAPSAARSGAEDQVEKPQDHPQFDDRVVCATGR